MTTGTAGVTMPTVYDFLNSAGNIALSNGIIFLVGRAMLKSMKRKGQYRRAFHGWYVWVWMMGGVMVGGSLLPWQALDMYRSVPLAMGILVGWFGGTWYGFWALRRFLEPTPETAGDENEVPPASAPDKPHRGGDARGPLTDSQPRGVSR